MKRKQGIALILALIVTVAAIWSAIGSMAEDRLATVWIMCKPGSYVSIREKPDKKSGERGYLDSGDSFQTTGESKDGWIRCCGAGEGGWVWCGYVVTEKPEKIGERYVCSAVKQVACRKWIGGPQVDEKPWLKNGQFVDVFLMADGWAVTSRGYIRAEYLDVSPR